MNTATPAIVTQTAVRRLPRLALFLFCIAYVLPGFLGREPWKVADVGAFGAMLEMASGHSSWWNPQVLGLPVEEAGPLPYWLGAIFIRALPFLSADLAARIPFALLLALTLSFTWYAVYHLARQRAAQPVAFAFGGEAQPTDYARALADAALLALVACLGLAQLAHETSPDLARLSAVSALLFGAARLAHVDDAHAWRGFLAWCTGTLALVFSGAPWMALLLGMGLWLAVWRARSAALTFSKPPTNDPWPWALAAMLVGAVAAGWLTLTLPAPLSGWNFAGWARWGRMLSWFTWPAWPLVLWTLWRWRRQWRAVHVAIPLWVMTVGLIDSAINPDFDRALLLALPAFAALAAFALPTLGRSVAALIDWFTLLFFSGCALIIWVVWLSMMTGVPAKPAANVARLAPGFVPEFGGLLFVAAALATLAWVWLVSWRVGAHRQALWKSLVLPAGGATLCWLLLMTLWLPLLDFGRSYGPISRRIASLVPAGSCVAVDGLTQAQIAALQYHGQLRLVRTVDAALVAPCRSMVVHPDTQPTLSERVKLTDWAFRATVRRLSDRKESLLLYQRVGR